MFYLSLYDSSLFKPPRGQVSNSEETDVSSDHRSQPRPRAQTFLRHQVSMATELQPVSQSAAVPRPLPGLGPPAAGGPLQPMQEKGTKKAHVLPMTPQPLHIQGAVQTDWLLVCIFKRMPNRLRCKEGKFRKKQKHGCSLKKTALIFSVFPSIRCALWWQIMKGGWIIW